MKNLRNRLCRCKKNNLDPFKDDRFSKIWMVLKIFGFYTIGDDWKFNGRALIFSIILIVNYTNDLKNVRKSLIDGVLKFPNDVELLSHSYTSGTALYRLYMLIRHRESLKRLVRYVNEEFPSWITCPDMKNKIRNSFKRGSWVFTLSILQLTFIWLLMFLQPLLSTEPYALVMEYPFGRYPIIPADRFPFYQITYFLQVFFMSIEIGISFSTNMLFFLLSMNVCAYLECLPMEMEKAIGLQDTTSETLNVFIDRYNVTKEFIDLLNSYFSIILYVIPVYASFSIVTKFLAFDRTRKTLSFVGVGIIHMWELYIFCYVGELVMEKSCEVARKIYASRWYNFSEMDKKKVLQIMQRSDKPFTIKAGLFGNLSRYTFTNTMKTTYSIWTVANQIKYK